MFYIFDLYNKFTLDHYDYAVFGSATKNFISCTRVGKKCVFSSLDDIDFLVVGVYDSSDDTKEYYHLFDLMNIIKYNKNISINGLEYTLLRRLKNRGVTSYLGLDSINSLRLDVTLSNPSKDFLNSITKNKLIGREYTDKKGYLIGYNSSMLKDGVLIIPDGIVNISRFRDSYNDCSSLFNSVYIPKSLNIHTTNLSNLCNLRLSGNIDSKGGCFIFEGDINITSSRLFDLKCPLIKSLGKIKYNKSELKRVFIYSESLIDCIGDKIYLVDKDSVTEINFNDLSVVRKKQ